jgi:hypothetical protein
VVLPWLVRGRSLAADLVGGALWAVSLAAGATAAAGAEPRGVLAGALAGAAAAVALRWVRSPRAAMPGRAADVDRDSGGGH